MTGYTASFRLPMEFLRRPRLARAVRSQQPLPVKCSWWIRTRAVLAFVAPFIAVRAAEVPTNQPPSAAEWLARARGVESRGLMKQAIEFAGKAIATAPGDPKALYFRAALFERTRQFAPAESDLNRAIELAPGEPSLLFQRGLIRLRLSDFEGAVSDFNRFAERRPARAATLWERGIALFYAGRYEEARRQFELHRTINPRDVENSAWHFACVAHLDGLKRAQAEWMNVHGDTRVPMKEIQDFMKGQGSEAAVMEAADAVPDPHQHAAARFYGLFYRSLFHGAEGRHDLEAKCAAEAAGDAESFGLMGDIALVHADWVASQLRRQAR